jgi:phage protein U
MSIDPKASQKFHKGEIKNNELTLKLKRGGKQQSKKEGL